MRKRILSVRSAMKYMSEAVSGKRKMKMGKERLAGALSGAYFIHFNSYHSRNSEKPKIMVFLSNPFDNL